MNAPFPQRTRPISIAILAMGGEGGGVLADWIIDLAESNHYIAQLTSVPGVAQRTGATIYYLEWMCRIRDGLPEFIPPRWIDPDQRPRQRGLPHLAGAR